VLVDSEPKPSAQAQNADWMFRPESIVCEQSGRANNWSCGYMASADLLERASDAVRKEIERCGSLIGLMTISSHGGGTGSGLGSRLLEQLKCEYPEVFLANVGVLPGGSQCGSPLQSYNVTFSLAWAHEFSDCLILYDNDLLLNNMNSNNNNMNDGSGSGRKSAQGFQGVNSKIAEGLCSLFSKKEFDVGSLVTELAPMPTHKMIQIFSARSGHKGSKPIATWDVLSALSKELPSKVKFSGFHSVISSQVNLRGKASNLPIRTPYLPNLGLKGVGWNSLHCEDVIHDSSSLPGNLSSHGVASLAMNWCHPASTIDPLLQIAEQKWRKRCFVHWYEQQGVGDIAFDAALTFAREACESYFAVDM
jgi:hypothetical protein